MIQFYSKCLVSENLLVDDEVAYMKKLREAISPAPSNWFTMTDMCAWSYVSCIHYSTGLSSIQEIKLGSKSLNGTLPSGINNSLLNLKILDLSNNNLTGPLPSFAGLIILQELKLGLNNFTSVPDGCFQGLTHLRELHLDYNANLAPWTFPATLSDSSMLNILTLSNTNLMGSLPDAFHSFRDLEVLDISENSLTGSLPNSFDKLLTLQALFLDKQNKLSGKIEFLSSMTQLKYVGLRGNSFEGHIPDLSNCTKLRELYLDGNQLTGVVPPSLVNLSFLRLVLLDNNWLQGPTPVFKENVNASFKGNGFCLDHPGPCDHTVTTLLQVAEAFGQDQNPQFDKAEPHRNHLTGICHLRELYLGGNSLNGSIPESLTTLSQLKILDVSNNNLSGTVPRFSPNTILNTANNAFLVWSSLPPKASPPPPPSTNGASPTASNTTRHLWIKLDTRGTPGYIAPEVFSRTYGGVSHKSDVYSYGMLILEIIGGRENYHENGGSQTSEVFPDWIYNDLKQGNVPTRCLPLREEENDMVMKMTLVSLWCIQPNPLDRPSISKVIDMLEGSLKSIPHPPKPVLFSSERLISQYSDISYGMEHETSSTTTVDDLEKGTSSASSSPEQKAHSPPNSASLPEFAFS
ncbi:hypothetical protein PIB30_025749 [Stylosanthes scabra]|uniref:Protein kinase domain-containing protein n=1 Tax=Stylosanthes scabra TaxID=79078 RepID=A0ABU6RAE7_9FABA|nr:hypothetical protein [Stylosanthes scabra]